MFKFKKKYVIRYAVVIVLLLFLASLIPAIRISILNTFKHPLSVLTFIRREIGAIIFYHQNFIQNERFRKEIGFYKTKLNNINEIYLENTRLKNLLLFKDKSNYNLVAARVIGHMPDNWSSGVIVDKGKRSGIKRGMVVINYLGLVGRVIEVTDSTSKIMLINDSNLSVSGRVVRSRQEGLVSGALGGSLIMRYLPKESDIQISDTVITSGLTEVYPKGLVIGQVVEIGEEFSGLTRYAVIKPAVQLSNIEEVLIIIP